MASVEQLERALVAADAAGDTAGATALAGALKTARAQSGGGMLRSALGASQAASAVAPAKVDPVSDVLQSVGSGLVRGTASIPALPGALLDLGAKGTNWVQGQLGTSEKDRVDPEFFQKAPVSNMLPRQEEIENFISDKTGWKPYESQTDLGRYAGTAAEFVPSAFAGGLVGGVKSAVNAAVKYGAGPGLLSEAGGDVAAAAYGEDKRPVGQVIGALGGPAAMNAAKRVVTPFPAEAGKIDAANTLRAAGVESLTPGQQTGNMALRRLEGDLGGSKVASLVERQGEEFTAAAIREAGMDDAARAAFLQQGGKNADRVGPDTMIFLSDRVGQKFNDLASRNTLDWDVQFVQDLSAARNKYTNVIGAPNVAPAIDKFVQEIGDLIAQGPSATGRQYQSLRSRMAATARSASNPELKTALNEYAAALDNAMERSIAQSNPADSGLFGNARREYRNLMVIERAAGARGELAAGGVISPSNLHGATQAVTGKRSYVRGKTDFDELARAGEVSMTPLPRNESASGAAARAVVSTAPAALGGTIGAVAGWGNPAAAAVGAAAGAAVGGATSAAARSILMSPLGRKYLANQLLGKPPSTPAEMAVALALQNATAPIRIPDLSSEKDETKSKLPR